MILQVGHAVRMAEAVTARAEILLQDYRCVVEIAGNFFLGILECACVDNVDEEVPVEGVGRHIFINHVVVSIGRKAHLSVWSAAVVVENLPDSRRPTADPIPVGREHCVVTRLVPGC